MDWLHYVGRAYYTEKGFKYEAQAYGVSRKASLKVLTGMSWHDRIWLAQGDMKSKRRVTPTRGSTIFGRFTLTRLAGLSPEAMAELRENFSMNQVEPGGAHVKRGCGTYITGPGYAIQASLKDITNVLKGVESLGFDLGVILLQGHFTPLDPTALLPEVTFRWGFQKFDSAAFLARYFTEKTRQKDSGSTLVIPGTFPVRPGMEIKPVVHLDVTPMVQETREYRQAELYRTLAEQEAVLSRIVP